MAEVTEDGEVRPGRPLCSDIDFRLLPAKPESSANAEEEGEEEEEEDDSLKLVGSVDLFGAEEEPENDGLFSTVTRTLLASLSPLQRALLLVEPRELKGLVTRRFKWVCRELRVLLEGGWGVDQPRESDW